MISKSAQRETVCYDNFCKINNAVEKLYVHCTLILMIYNVISVDCGSFFSPVHLDSTDECATKNYVYRFRRSGAIIVQYYIQY